MKIDKAIVILQDSMVGVEALDDPDLPVAIKLGIEALKGIEAVRQLHPELSPFPLPGEKE